MVQNQFKPDFSPDGNEVADDHATEIAWFLTLEANPERLSKCRNVWPTLKPIPPLRRPLGMEGSKAQGMGGGFRGKTPRPNFQNSGAAELACRMPASWRTDSSATGGGATGGDAGAIGVTMQPPD